MKKIAVVYSILSFVVVAAFGQVNSGLLTTISAIAGMRDRFPIEKLHLQLDKPYYALGDTIRFKAYLLNADFLKPSIRSGLLYVEMDAADGKMIKRIMVPLIQGLSWGDMPLADKDFPEGSYTLRAYTNWMLNFGDDYVFKKNLYISALSNSTLVKANFKLQTGAEKDKVNASLLLFGLDKNPFRVKDMQLEVLNGKHSLLKDKATTGVDGSLQLSFDADKTAVHDLSITAQEIRKVPDETPPLIIPVLLNRAENTDVQFMPEGGHIAAGLPLRIGFKAISEDGRGTEVSGKVLNSKQQEVAAFASAHKGMGSFELTPQAGDVYSAKVTLAGGLVKTYPLPAVSVSGTALRVTPKGNDSLEITLSATPDLLTSAAAATYYLFGETRGLVCYTAAINFKGGVVKRVVDKGSFPTGIAHFTLFNQTNQPVNERIVYIAHNDNLRISITPDQAGYGLRDSMAVALTVKDAAGKPVRGSFSVAVTDDSQVRADSLGNNLVSDMLLTSDLKGNVEEPGWYFESATPEHITALDNLLLTQGWIGYDWKAIFNPVAAQPQFPVELKFLVEGRVTNVFNKGVEKSEVLIFSGKPQMMKQTETDKDGKFVFNDLFPVDTAQFKIQARNKAGKSFNVSIEILNQFKPPVFSANGSVMPWYVNTDSILLNNSAVKARQQQAKADLMGEGHMLKEVVINEKKSVKGSKNLNGPGQADQVMDEQDMLNAGKMTLEELLVKNVRGFMPRGGMWSPCPSCDMMATPPKTSKSLPTSYTLNNKMVHFVFDGVDVNTLFDGTHLGPWADLGQSKKDPAQDRYDFLKGYLDYFSAEDIKGVEVLYNIQFSGIYSSLGFSADENMNYGSNLAFIEITTRSGKGPNMKVTPGTYLYKPLAFSVAKQFYRPRYTYRNKMADRGTDLRSTIHWAPQVITDKDGKATVSFFSADKPADYTITVEGTDLQGNLGYARGRAVVNATASGASTINNVKPSILSAISRAQDRLGVEKLYMQLDKPYYTVGDTLHFKGYLVDGSFLSPSTKSGLMYVELDNVIGKAINTVVVPVSSGMASGSLALDGQDIPEGSYTLRAYTSWMLNFGEDYVYKKGIYISSVNGNATLVKGDFKLESGADKDKITAAIKLTGLDGNPMRLQDMRLRIFSGYKTLFRDNATTGMDGTLHLNFDLADKTVLTNLYVQAQKLDKAADTAVIMIPVDINRPEKTDVQYLPEGGNLVAGIPTKVGFKAISEDGKGAEINGRIVNSKQQEVARFQTTHKGMGVFELTPQAGETYSAKVNAPNNTFINYPLPAVTSRGTTLKVIPKGKDSLEVTLNASSDIPIAIGTSTAPVNYYLIGQVRGVVYYGAMVSFKGVPIKKVIAKNVFPAGIAHFTLLNSASQPLNERLFYINRDNNLQVSLAAIKPSYFIRDSIAVNVTVKDKDGKPVQGNFSLAVTDGAQVSTDSTSNIITSLLFTSDLKGNVEDPGWYFENDNPDHITALDNLMLTQGWTGYDWKTIFTPSVQPPKYKAEKEFTVQGTLTNVFNKPLKQTNVSLLQKKPLIVKGVLTDNEGRFIFKGPELFPSDSAFYMIEAKSKNGDNKDFNIGVEVDEFKPPAFALPKQRLLPWYFNSDTTLLNNAATKIAQLKAEANITGGGHQLKEVVIREKKIIPTSHNLNGPGGADVIIDEKELNKEKNKTLFDVMKDKFPDFHKVGKSGGYKYYLDYHRNERTDWITDLRIDGVFISPLKLIQEIYMEGLKASDIKGVEVMTSSEYGMAYAVGRNPLDYFKPPQVYLEITTYSGHGAFLNNTPGRYIYRPIPPALTQKFYSPKYTVNNRNIAMSTDLRSTIHWEPNLITDKNGKATVSFYSADRPADYTLILEGTDMNGGFGYSRQKIKVAGKGVK